ncbi:MAG: hypothetical protein O3B95_11630 [Chloroflexi bacterium]|nr:hypothetical protein [Chloroflexota bacterium]
MKKSLGFQVRQIEIDGAWHALLPEQPMEVASVIISFLNGYS